MRRGAKRGIVLASVLIMLVVMLMMGLAMSVMGTANLNSASQSANGERAYQAAEAAVNLALLKIGGGSITSSTTQTYRIPMSPTADEAVVKYFVNSQATAQNFPDCPVQVPPGLTYVLSEGRAKADGRVVASKRVGALVSSRFAGVAAYGVLAQTIELSGGPGVLQAETPDGSAARAEEPLLATNSTSPLAVRLNGNEVQGKLVVPDGSPDNVVDDPARIQGGILELGGPLNFPRVSVPSPGEDRGDRVVTTALLSPGHYRNLTVRGEARLEPGVYTVDNLTVEAGGSLKRTGREAKIYVLDQLVVSPATIPLRNEKSSNRMRFFYMGTSPVALTLGSASNCTVTAPQADLEVNLQGTVRGALAAKNIKLNLSGGSFIFDLGAKMTALSDPPNNNNDQEYTEPKQQQMLEAGVEEGEPQPPAEHGPPAATVMGVQRF